MKSIKALSMKPIARSKVAIKTDIVSVFIILIFVILTANHKTLKIAGIKYTIEISEIVISLIKNENICVTIYNSISEKLSLVAKKLLLKTPNSIKINIIPQQVKQIGISFPL